MERHHMISLCFPFGIDHESNIILLTQAEHKHLHETLNVPWHILRKFRKDTNHIFTPNRFYVSEVIKLHRLYFKNLHLLPLHIQEAHKVTMRCFCNHWYQLHNLKCKTRPESFWDYLGVFHNSLYVLTDVT